jgi:hypothetical protein
MDDNLGFPRDENPGDDADRQTNETRRSTRRLHSRGRA